MGYGDFKLLGALGAWFGWKALPGDRAALVDRRRSRGDRPDRARRRGREVPIPFGPYLRVRGCLRCISGIR
jgi:leader peptidase (prepilin peptidase)/N-methyltransferase